MTPSWFPTPKPGAHLGQGQMRALGRAIAKEMANSTAYKDTPEPTPSRQSLRREVRVLKKRAASAARQQAVKDHRR